MPDQKLDLWWGRVYPKDFPNTTLKELLGRVMLGNDMEVVVFPVLNGPIEIHGHD